MKVLLLVDSLGNGGLERQLSLLAANLPPDWEARVWAMGRGPFETYLRGRGVAVTVEQRLSRFDVLTPTKLWWVLETWRPDVVHVWSWISALAAEPMARVLRIPTVNGMIRGGAVSPDHVLLKRLALAGATVVVANTQAGLRAWGVDSSRGHVVYNGFDESRLATVGDRIAEDRTSFTVVMTGRMTPVKDYDLVIRVARRLSEKQDRWRFLLVGDGPNRERLQRDARDLVEAGVVVFREPGTEVLGVVREADAGVLMTDPRLTFEGLSNSIVEYMAMGLPVVCGDGGGNPEIVRDGMTGFIVPPADPAALAGRLRYLRDNPERRAAMGAAGRAYVLTALSVPRMVEGMVGVYEDALALTTARRRVPHRLTLRG